MNHILQEDARDILKQDISWGKFDGKHILVTGASGMLGVISAGRSFSGKKLPEMIWSCTHWYAIRKSCRRIFEIRSRCSSKA